MKEKSNNHVLPFLWVHGESEETYRHMINVIYDTGIRDFCVEARPHKEFCRDGWWFDMDIIIDEAEKLGMRIWILDDEHFPTGYAAGAVLNAPVVLRRQFLCHKQLKLKGGKKYIFDTKAIATPDIPKSIIEKGALRTFGAFNPENTFYDDTLLSCTAFLADGTSVDLIEYVETNQIIWDAPKGQWTVEVVSLSRNSGYHRNYINMIDTKSCQLQIEAVYEPHFKHYGDKFGTTIAGFFSDEPEFGNGNYLDHMAIIGKEQSLPYSPELALRLENAIGKDWIEKMYLLWGGKTKTDEEARIRYLYMNCLTQLVSETFSMQIGEWCRNHGVEYIGHMLEDENQHARTGSGLGHYFRGLKGQTMAGIDNIGGQVQFGGEDFKKKSIMGFILDGEFYHYSLGKLASSLAALSPRMRGRAMCENFGNYGWKSGVREQKYLLDHFLVRGVNYYVPHAFTCSPYPEKDCPPHFYAQGNNPQYRHFGKMMQYGERICKLISAGRADVKAGILYHGEAEWCGECMLMQEPARVLADNQIDYYFIPGDVFTDREFYRTSLETGLCVNDNVFDLLIIPFAQYLPEKVLEGIGEISKNGTRVLFIDKLPQKTCEGAKIPEFIERCEVVTLEKLLKETQKTIAQTVTLFPKNNRVRAYHYIGKQELYMLTNEGSERYQGTVILPTADSIYEYDAWDDICYEIDCKDGKTIVEIDPRKSCIFILGDIPADAKKRRKAEGKKYVLRDFKVSSCEANQYPHFTERKIKTKFSGVIRYEADVDLEDVSSVVLDITEAYEGVEVFVNGVTAGIQVVPHFTYDITSLCKKGSNRIAIEVATTLERKHKKFVGKCAPIGLTGDVNLYCRGKHETNE